MIVSDSSDADMIDLDNERNQQETNFNQEKRCLSMELRRDSRNAAADKQARDNLVELIDIEGKMFELKI